MPSRQGGLATTRLTVATPMAAGLGAARLAKLYPVEAPIINLTHGGMRGAGLATRRAG